MIAEVENRALLAEALEEQFHDMAIVAAQSPETERLQRGELPAEVWARVEETGLTLVLVPERDGGFGGGWEDAFVLLYCSGFYAVRAPIADTTLARGLLSHTAIATPPGAIAVACGGGARLKRGSGGLQVCGTAAAVPWASAVPHILVVCCTDGLSRLALVESARAAVSGARRNLAGEPVADLRFDDVDVLGVGFTRDDPFRLGALMRVAMMAGALGSVLHQSVQHACEREQFGRPIGKFQAIQHLLAVLASEVAAVDAAARSACRAADRGDAAFEIAAAKLRANRAAGKAASIAHQVHGAMGFTAECKLHLATQRLWSWRSEYGNDRYWASRLGAMVSRRGAQNLWSDLTAR